jgi:hypothetical protein
LSTLRVALALLLGLAACMPAYAQQPPTSNLVSGSANSTDTAAHTIITAPTATRRIYVTSGQCGRTDAGTTAIKVTLNDIAGTVLVLPNSGGGGGNNAPFPAPLTVPAATALTFTSSASTSTVYCSAQGFTGD